ncbi:hypothetical protein U9M48_041840 [Paspalum notatum var. saurae]|uniref:Diacylglycerol acyltransferase 3 n=1 Tax=Paspalum notatum var. saurae TaxID=547442 RepID=A0AAQ3UTX5_PASNO
MDLAGAALRRSALPSAAPVGARGRGSGSGRRRAPGRVACVGGGGFAEEGHIRYYDAAPAPAPRRKAVEAVARDLARLRAMGLVAGDAAQEEVLSQAADLLLQQLNQMKDEECKTKEAQKEEKAAMKALKKQQEEAAAKKAATAMTCEEEGYSSESSESDCEEEPTMRAGQGMAVSAAVPEVVASSVSTVSGAECEKAAVKAMKKMEKERMKAQKKMEKERKKAAKRAMKMEKEARKMAMATAPNGCRDGEDDSSCSSESSDSECDEGQVIRMSRCATITAPEAPPSPTAVFPVIVPQIPAPLAPQPPQAPQPATAVQVQAVGVSSLAMAETTSAASRIEVCMGGKCKKAGALALLQEFEKAVGTGGAAVGCKCLGKCGLGPNVRLRSDLSAEGSAKGNPLCIGVGLEDVGTIVAGLFGDGDLGTTPN